MGDIFGLVIVRPLGLILLGIFKAIGSYGLAVILFALLVKLICIPLAIKGKKSMLAMNALNAEMQQLQKKYANNRIKLNEEIQKLYDKHGVNPMSGCLPQFIPLPIMMGLYYAVQQPLKFMMGFNQDVINQLAVLVGVDTATAGYYSQITIAEKLGDLFTQNGGVWPEAVTNITNGAGELLNIDFNFLGLNLAQTPTFPNPSILWIIPILSGATAFLSSFVMQKMQGTQNSAAAGQMKVLNIMMPLMSLYFGFILPGAIGIYWIFNNIFACVQEIVLTTYLRGKKEKKDAEEFARVEAEKEAKRAASRAAQQEQSQNAKKKKGDK
ncbi:YidC/Oxa1 family membrane protein insertase [Candidatus Agathobaculum pullicola]|uniref:YidC/Oxa1 family membrane protein insertase n=1 Tax=Candidatus Agathobaculum pullicola TaxID=2838426 RepID=UPI003F93CEB9